VLVYLAALGAGSAWVSRFGRRWAGVGTHLAIAHALMALTLLVAVSMVNRLPYWYIHTYQRWQPETFFGILVLSVGIVLTMLLWPVLLAGTVLPLVLVGALDRAGERAGPVVGRLYAVNTAGAIVGAVLTGFYLIPHLGSEAALLAVAGAPTDMTTQVLLAQIPLLVAPRAEDVFVVGWGSGVTVGSALASPVRHVTAAEIEPAVVEASRFFVHVNHDPQRDPRLRLYEDDARHILPASDETYDWVISEPPHPWAMGVANIFTQDFYRLVDRRLRDGGVFA